MKKIGKATYLTERKEIVEFMKDHPCIRLDLSNPVRGYETIFEGDLVGVKCPSRNFGNITVYGTMSYYKDKNKYVVSNVGSCIKASFGAEDVNTIVERKNAPVVEKEQLVAIIENYSYPNGCSVRVMKVSKYVDAHCCSVCTFEDVDL